MAKTIAVNHPLNYKGYTIYQASFGDGGSKLDFRLHDLASPAIREHSIIVDQSLPLEHGGESYQVEMDEFRKFNIFANEDPAIDKKFRDFRPERDLQTAPDRRAGE